MSEEHGNFIKTPKQLVIIVVVAFVVPIMFIILLSQLMTGDKKMRPDEQPTAVAERIKPIGELVVATPAVAPAPAPVAAAVPASAPAPVAAGATPAPAPVAVPTIPVAAPTQTAATGGKGKTVYDTTCMVCHAAGIAGSPKIGDKAAWAPRIQTGIEALYSSALKGKNAMPPKGGNVSLPDADIKAAVDYMVAQAK
jgi:cytochrome c5